MISGDGSGLSFPDICLTVVERTRENLNQENWPDRVLNSDSLAEMQRRLPVDHNGSDELGLLLLKLCNVFFLRFFYFKR